MKTRYLDAGAVARMIGGYGTVRVIELLARDIRDDYLRWPEFEKCARMAHHSSMGVIELMPVSDGRRYAFKYVNGHPGNALSGLPTVLAFGVLADVATGYPLLLADLTLATALRTAATSALAARAMACAGARTMALIGNGAQSEFQALAFHTLVGITEIRAYDIDRHATDKLMTNLAGVEGLRVIAAGSAEEAVRGADIVTTATADKRRASVLRPQWLAPGTHVNAVGGDSPGKTELHPAILRQARIVVEYEAQTRIEGEIQQLPASAPVVPLWQVLSGARPGRETPEQITVFDSVGFALEDFSALRCLLDLAQATGAGQDVQLVPDLADPRNLYALLAAQARATEPAAATS
ncbi:ornithine cyclodeaminase [Pigmentiphaga kullae]|uniref:Ornithine cyclodeaminase n=1 Tax=Pigmentiphaga kullae TaxID=151784 RepID=A0A4Q7NCX5_9BURK|nr:ornithine cyclodeaminase [Pigmentiphaga kullae]RZS80892.1 ornithine cyclodeaminase [Pigmentiphaga kullae]